jgi:3-isopropylmalate/(R)-2-methylmalate dehydratase small subunit
MTVLQGKVWVFGDGINTDSMYPGFAMKLPFDEAARHVFYELRPGWVDEVQPGDIVVGGRNFGVGSSRPVGRLFAELGVAALLADEFNGLFHRNAINYGMPALTVPSVSAMFAEGEQATVDLTTGAISNVTTGAQLQVPGLSPLLLDILDAGGLMPQLAREGYIPS